MPTPEELRQQLAEYVRIHLLNGTMTGQMTVKDLKAELAYVLDQEGVESEAKERKLERLRKFAETLRPNTKLSTVSTW